MGPLVGDQASHPGRQVVTLSGDGGLGMLLGELLTVALHQLPLKAMQAIEPKITADALAVLSVEASVKSRTSYGGTAPKNVRAQAKAWLKRLEKERKPG